MNYKSAFYHLNDYLFNMGSHDLIIISAIPEKTLNYKTMLKIFDIYVWIFVSLSVISVTVTMVIIEKTSATWIGNSARKSIHQCTYIKIHCVK